MKHKKIFVMIITLITIICTFAACSGTGGPSNDDPPQPPNPPSKTEYTVTFETNGGSLVNAVTTSEIKTEPVTTKEGFTFDGWFEDAQFVGEKITFPYTILSSATIKLVENGLSPLSAHSTDAKNDFISMHI